MATEVAVDAHGLFDGPSYTELPFSNLMALARGSGIARGEDNGCSPSVSSSNVRVATGKVFIKGFYGTITANKDVTPTAPHATLNRIDRVVLRLDRSDNEITVGIVTGTAASTPAAPSLTQNSTIWETRIAQVLVTGGSGALTVTDEREYARGIGELPPGTILQGGYTALPSGFLVANGQAVSRTTYWELFAEIGTAYGTGNGSTTFNVPDARGRFLLTLDNTLGSSDAGRLSGSNTLGGSGGSEISTLATHSHTGAGGLQILVGSAATSTLFLNAGSNIDHGNNTNVTYSTTADAGSAATSLPPYQLVNAIVKI